MSPEKGLTHVVMATQGRLDSKLVQTCSFIKDGL